VVCDIAPPPSWLTKTKSVHTALVSVYIHITAYYRSGWTWIYYAGNFTIKTAVHIMCQKTIHCAFQYNVDTRFFDHICHYMHVIFAFLGFRGSMCQTRVSTGSWLWIKVSYVTYCLDLDFWICLWFIKMKGIKCTPFLAWLMSQFKKWGS